MSNGPPPSVRCLLGNIHRHIGEKVRFLGCVTHYNPQSAILTLEHNYDTNKTPARVDAKLLVETLKSEQIDIGQWVHVIGYVKAHRIAMTKSRVRYAEMSLEVQALVLWTAEDLDISAYEKTFDSDKVVNREDPSKPSSTHLVE
ncbi:CST complex subunit Ten1 [Annulohypoxylon moriforme]|nr:CST complex subunit Ten1 [Annulohypoxylon moriforme]